MRTACVVAAAPSPGIVGRARTAATRALLRRVVGLGIPAFVLSPEPEAWEDLHVEVVTTPREGFRLGEALADLVEEKGPERLLYFSAGSGFLLSSGDIRRMAEFEGGERFILLNNFYSTDFCLISPPHPEILRRVHNDNALGWGHWEAGYRCYELPRGARTQLDIDTPGELKVLAHDESLDRELREALSDVPAGGVEELFEALTTPGKRILLAGRVSGHLLRYLERASACRVTALSEGRGMKAEGLPVRSLLKEILEAKGPEGLVRALAGAADVVVWDVRVLFGSLGIWPEAEERFAFDLLEVQRLRDPLLRELAEAMGEAPVPFLLGGHSLVSGAMYLAVELAWRGMKGKAMRAKIVRLEEEDEGIVEIRPGGSG